MAPEFKFNSTLYALRTDLQQLVRQKEELEKQIAATKQSIMGLLTLRDAALEDVEPSAAEILTGPIPSINEYVAESLGLPTPTGKLKDLCRSVLRASGNTPMTAPQIKHELELMGFDFSGYDSNPLSSIHTVLKRIPEISCLKVDGRTVYKWNGIMPPPGYQSGLASLIATPMPPAPGDPPAGSKINIGQLMKRKPTPSNTSDDKDEK